MKLVKGDKLVCVKPMGNLDYANTDESTILSWKRDEMLKDLGI